MRKLADDYGFRFSYFDGELDSSEYLSDVDISAIARGKGNRHNLYIFCEGCGEYMDYYTNEETDEIGWKCSRCGEIVDGFAPYLQLESENEEYLADDIFDDEDDETELYDDDDEFELYRKCHPDD